MTALSKDKQWWTGFQKEQNFFVKDGLLTVNIYDPPDYSSREIKAELNPHTPFGHELSHLLAGAFYFKGFDPSGAYIWKEKITDDFDPGRALFYECWVIHGQVITDPKVALNFKLERHKNGEKFLLETYPIINKIQTPEKWIERWNKLKEQIDEMTLFRSQLSIDPWWPSGFDRINLGKLT